MRLVLKACYDKGEPAALLQYQAAVVFHSTGLDLAAHSPHQKKTTEGWW